jgi:hypothetical protein
MSQREEIKNWLTRLAVALLLPALTGCEFIADHSLTVNLWNADYDPDRHFATTNSVPGLFQTKDGKDIMVRYSEERDRDFIAKRRAYLLHQNEALIAAGKRPDFVNAKKADKLVPIPMLSSAETNSAIYAQSLHGVMAADGQHFTLSLDGRESGPYALPSYITGDRRAARLVLTPAAVVGDVVIYTVVCGTIAGLVVAYFYANGQQR